VRVASGGTALDPRSSTQMLGASRRLGSLSGLSAREARSALAQWPRGAPTRAIANGARLSEGAVEKHVANIFAKLRPAGVAVDHRRVLAVLAIPRLLRCCLFDSLTGHSPWSEVVVIVL